MDAVGKTIARIEGNPVGEYFSRDADTVLIHFTDGTALKIEGGSYEPVDQSVDLLTTVEAREFARRAQGLRQREWLQRLQRQEWLSISCEERGNRKRAREQAMSPFARILSDTYTDVLSDTIMANNRFFFGGRPERRVRMPCENCGERACPNATVKVYPAEPAPDWSTVSFRVEAGGLGPTPST